ncbi:hypothetical protein PENTCL1PPCAC_20989, partial [Pristionchus entomophagus]
AHLVDTIKWRRPDFVHATASKKLVLVVDRFDKEKWHIFHMGPLAYLTTDETMNIGDYFDYGFSEMLDDQNMLFWKRGGGRIAMVHTAYCYFTSTSSTVTIYELDLAIYWVAHDDHFVYFGGQEAKQVRPKGAKVSLPAPRNAPFVIYCTKIDAKYHGRELRLLWRSRPTDQ